MIRTDRSLERIQIDITNVRSNYNIPPHSKQKQLQPLLEEFVATKLKILEETTDELRKI